MKKKRAQEDEKAEEKNAIEKRLEFMESKCDVGGLGEAVATSGQMFLTCYWSAVHVIGEIGIDDPVGVEAIDVAKALMSRLVVNVQATPPPGAKLHTPSGVGLKTPDGRTIKLN